MHLNLLRAPRRAAVIGGTSAVLVLASVGVAWADPFGWWATRSHPFAVRTDTGGVSGNVLANDHGATAVVRSTGLDSPSAGSLAVHPDGSYTFTPAVQGSHGTVHFGYTATDAVTVYSDAVPGGDKIPSLGSLEGPNGSTVRISGGGYGSSFVATTPRAWSRWPTAASGSPTSTARSSPTSTATAPRSSGCRRGAPTPATTSTPRTRCRPS